MLPLKFKNNNNYCRFLSGMTLINLSIKHHFLIMMMSISSSVHKFSVHNEKYIFYISLSNFAFNLNIIIKIEKNIEK